MLVESWGERSDALDKMAEEISARGFHVIKHGFTTYRGSTLSGEFRELCAKYLQPSDGLIDEVKNLQCAPRYMHERQYSVIGMHGYEKAFYARSTFWSRFGVEQQVFGNELRTLPQCPGPFPGTCDENLIGYGIDRLDASNTPTFLYMLTLSSHEPLDPESSSQRGRYFNDIDVAHPTQIVTRRAISELIEKLQNRKSRACTLAYIVGDHQPPSASSKGGIFEPGKVPYLVFSINCP
jgi:hypothetical protein